MKTKSLFVMMMFVLPFILTSCGKNEIDNGSFDFMVHDYRVENVLYPKGSKLKRVYQVYSDGSRLLRPEYSYDEMERISRVDWDFESWKRWEIYLYNEKGQLGKISSYEAYLENSPDLLQTVVYSYDTEGNKIKEQTEWSAGIWYNLYQYNDKQLVRQENYKEDLLSSYRVYEYKGDKLVKENLFVPGEEADYVTTEHFYEQNLLIYSITYNKDQKSGFISDTKRYYDKNDNLIKTVSPSLNMLGGIAFDVIWEYEYE